METKIKKSYTKPTLMSEVFVPQEYCASCKDAAGVTTYSANCDTSGYVFEDTNMNGTLDFGIDKYKNYNTAGTTCNFTIDYYPGEKNAFIIPISQLFFDEAYLYEYTGITPTGFKEKYLEKAINGYRIEADGNSHFIANLNSTTIKPNLS